MKKLIDALPFESRKTLALAVIGGLGLPLVVAACGTIIHGSSQEVGISSNPTEAHVTIDNKDIGTTPLEADLSRKEDHTVRIELEGYKPFETKVTNSVSGWVFGNIIFGGLIGLAVDAISGGLYKLNPDNVEADLREGQAAYNNEDGKFLIYVVLEPKDDWEKIGQLEPASR